MRMLSTIQSDLDVRRRSLNPAGILKFASLPESWTEPPAPLRQADSESYQVAESNLWVASQTSALLKMAAVPNNDAEGYRHGIIKQLQEFSKALDKRIRDQWDLEKVRHLYKSQPTEEWPCIYHTGPLRSTEITVTIIDLSLLSREPLLEERPLGAVCPSGVVLRSGYALHCLCEST